MTIEQMNYLITTAECGSISNAARILFVSQPHLSKSIQSAENEIGYPIFLRTPQGVALTENGHSFIKHCSIIIQEYNRALTLSAHKTIHSFHLSARSVHGFIYAFARLCAAYQNSDIIDRYMNCRNTRQIIEEVYHGINYHLGLLLVRETEPMS